MDVNKCLSMLREIKDVAFATVDEEGMPQVRIIDVMLVEKGKMYFVTARGKDFHRELLASGTAAVTALTKDFEMIRLWGRVERLDDQRKWVDRIFEENPVMNEVYPGISRYILDAFRIADGEVEYFNLGCSPVFRESYSLGNGTAREKGYLIGGDCTGCGICAEVCPQSCIEAARRQKGAEADTPYAISQKNCLHCGLCQEKCPVGAVKRKGEQGNAE